MDSAAKNATTDFYVGLGGTQFVEASFADSPLIHCTTRRYRHFLEGQFPKAGGSLLDFGCGDGRLSLWAVEKGFSLVISADSNVASLKRLAAESRRRGLSNLLIICCDLAKPPVANDFFDAILCFEVLYYFVLSLGRLPTLNVPLSLLKPGGLLVLSEMCRYGRTLVDLVAMDVNNFRSLAEAGTRWEKSDQGRLEVFQWSPADLKEDCRSIGLQIVAESGVSPIAGLFDFAWKFTSYPLRPTLDPRLQEIIEALDDQTSESCNLARNILLALKKP